MTPHSMNHTAVAVFGNHDNLTSRAATVTAVLPGRPLGRPPVASASRYRGADVPGGA
jgi:hypothetical protein